MKNRTVHRSSFGFLVAVVAASLFSFGCGGNFSPAAPATPEVPSGTSSVAGSLAGQSVVSGQVQVGGGTSSAAGFSTAHMGSAVTLATLRVLVDGTDISDYCDNEGKFRLVNVPSGNIKLRFVGTGLDAQLALSGIGLQQHLNIKVQVIDALVRLLQEVREDLDEFDSIVTTIDRFEQTMTLTNGLSVKVDEKTWWDSRGDLYSFEEVADAVEGGGSVKVEGLGTTDDDGLLTATFIKAEADENEFEGVVTSANRTLFTLTLADGTVVMVGSETEWNAEGNVTTFEDLADLVEGGNEVKVEGEGNLQADGSILATAIKAEVEEVEFEGLAASVTAGALTLDDGTVVAVDSETAWDDDGNLFSLAEIASALAAGGRVEVEGEGFYQASGSILATTIKAKLEDDDDDKVVVDYSDEIDEIEELIEELEEMVEDGDLLSTDLNSLVSKLESAIKSLEKGNGNPAVGQLGAFINEVEAIAKTGRMSSEDAGKLIEKVQEIIAAIQDKS